MHIMNIETEKKAISGIVATVLLILIVISAALIIWLAVIPTIDQAMKLSDACTTAQLSIDTQSGYTCYDDSCKKANVVISRGADDAELVGVFLGLEGKGESVSYLVKEDPSVILSLNFDEGEGLNTTDSSGKNNNVTISGAEWGEGKYNSGISLASQADSVMVYNSPNLNIDENVTIEAWIMIDSTDPATTPDIILGRS